MEDNQEQSTTSSPTQQQHHARHVMFMEPNPSRVHFDEDYNIMKKSTSTNTATPTGILSTTSHKADEHKHNNKRDTNRVSRWRLQLNALPSSCFIFHPHNFGFRSVKPLLTTPEEHDHEPPINDVSTIAQPLLSFSFSHSEISDTSSLELVALRGEEEANISSSSSSSSSSGSDDAGSTIVGGVSCTATTCTVTSTGSGSVSSTDDQSVSDRILLLGKGLEFDNKGRMGMDSAANQQHLETATTTATGCTTNRAVSRLLLLECSAQGNLRIGVSHWGRGYYDKSLRALKHSAVAYKLLQNRAIFRGNIDTGSYNPQHIKVELAKVYLTMGRVYSSLDRHNKGKKYFKEALTILGYEHHQLEGSIITKTYTWNGCIEIECDHWTKLVTAQVLLALGETFEIIEPASALMYFQDSISIQKEIAAGPSSHHVDVGASLMSFGLYLEKMEDYSLALGCYEEARDTYQEQAGPYVSVGEGKALASIGWVQFLLGDLEGALSAYGESLQIQRSVLGWNHHSVGSLLAKQGAVYVELGKLKESLSLFQNALSIQRKCLGDIHEDIVTTLSLSGDAFGRLRAWETAKTFVKQAIHIRTQLVGDNHMLVAESCLQLGQICQASGDRVTAASCFKDVLQIYRSNRIPLTDRRMVEVQMQLVEVEKRTAERFVLRHCLSMQLH